MANLDAPGPVIVTLGLTKSWPLVNVIVPMTPVKSMVSPDPARCNAPRNVVGSLTSSPVLVTIHLVAASAGTASGIIASKTPTEQSTKAANIRGLKMPASEFGFFFIKHGPFHRCTVPNLAPGYAENGGIVKIAAPGSVELTAWGEEPAQRRPLPRANQVLLRHYLFSEAVLPYRGSVSCLITSWLTSLHL